MTSFAPSHAWCRPLPGHGSPWGSFVGGLTKRMRHMGLPLGRPSPHPLPPEEAEWAARHKKAALEAICRRSAAHVAQAAALESGVSMCRLTWRATRAERRHPHHAGITPHAMAPQTQL